MGIIVNGINIVVFGRSWYNRDGFAMFVVSCVIQDMDLVELICLVHRGVNEKGSFFPVDCGVGLGKPGESEDDVLFLQFIMWRTLWSILVMRT